MNYFNEEEIRPLVVEYKQIEPSSPRAKEILALLYPSLEKLVRTIIFLYAYNRFEPVDDLLQVGLENCIKSISSFNADYVNKRGKPTTLFNYFSLTAKRSMFFYTKRRQKHRNVRDLDCLVNKPGNYQFEETTFLIDQIEYLLPLYQPLITKTPEINKMFEYYIQHLREYKVFHLRHFMHWLDSTGRATTFNPSAKFIWKRFRRYITPALKEIQKKF